MGRSEGAARAGPARAVPSSPTAPLLFLASFPLFLALLSELQRQRHSHHGACGGGLRRRRRQVRTAPALNVRVVVVGGHVRVSPALDDFESYIYAVLDRCDDALVCAQGPSRREARDEARSSASRRTPRAEIRARVFEACQNNLWRRRPHRAVPRPMRRRGGRRAPVPPPIPGSPLVGAPTRLRMTSTIARACLRARRVVADCDGFPALSVHNAPPRSPFALPDRALDREPDQVPHGTRVHLLRTCADARA